MTVINTNYCTIDEAWGDLGNGKKKDAPKRKKALQDPICELYEAKANTSYNETDLVRFANNYYDKYDKSKYQRNMKVQPTSYESVEREPSAKSVIIRKDQSKYEAKRDNSSLFEKQFEMKLPALYDGDDCPVIPDNNRTTQELSSDRMIPTHQEYYNRPVTSEESRIPMEERLHIENYESDDEIEQEIIPPKYRYRPPTQEEQRRHYFLDDETVPYHRMKKQFQNIQYLDLILYVVSGIILIFLMEQFVRIGINLQS